MGIIYLVLTCLCFSLIPICVKIVFKNNAIDVYTLAFIRFFLAAITLLAIQYFRTGKVKLYFKRQQNSIPHSGMDACVTFTPAIVFKLFFLKTAWGRCLCHGLRPWGSNSKWVYLAGLGLGLDFIFFNLGLKYTTATATSLISKASQMAVMVLYGWLLLKEKANLLSITGFLVTLAGVVFVTMGGYSLKELFSSEYFIGNIIIAVSGIFWGAYAIFQKKIAHVGSAIEIALPIIIIGSVITGFTAVVQGISLKPVSFEQITAILVLGIVCTGFSYAFFGKALKLSGMVIAGVAGSFTPLFTAVIAVLFLNEALTLSVIIGTMLVLAGTIMLVFQEKSDTSVTEIN